MTTSAGQQQAGLGWPVAPPGSPYPRIALGIHAGLLIVCFCAVWTYQPPGIFTSQRWVPVVLVGLFLLLAAGLTRGRIALTRTGQLALALGAMLALSLGFDPQLSGLPGLSGFVPPELADVYYPSLSLIGVLVVFIAWLFFYVTGGERQVAPAPVRRAAVVVAVLLIGLGMAISIVLGRFYEMGSTAGILSYNVVQHTVLVVAILGCCGAPGVRGWPFVYISAALLLACARSLLLGGPAL